MFTVDEETVDAIRRAWNESGELTAVVKMRRHFQLIADGENVRRCVRAFVGWTERSAPDQERR